VVAAVREVELGGRWHGLSLVVSRSVIGGWVARLVTGSLSGRVCCLPTRAVYVAG
jgi:hypothetical protein